MSAAGEKSSGFWRVMFFGILLVLYFVLVPHSPSLIPVTAEETDSPTTSETDRPIKVKITNPGVETAIAYVAETHEADSLDENVLSLLTCSQGQHIFVWASGYYIKSVLCNGISPTEYSVSLDAISSMGDNPNYAWLDATHNCASCHAGQSLNLAEYSDWIKDGHSKVLSNAFFWTIYMGMDVNKNLSQQTQWSISGSGQRIRLTPDPTLPNYGPGYRLDYPNEDGNCAYCHVPASFPGMPQEMGLPALINSFQGTHVSAATEGVTCDVCHKVTEVALGNDQLPYVDRPGVLSMSFVRPSSPEPFFVGPKPFELIPEMGGKKTCSPVFSESRFCAACHYGKFGDVVIYNSYGEWRDSTYSKKEINSQENENYRSCQDCHMLHQEEIADTLPSERDACSETNQNFGNFNHNMMNYGPDPANPSREIPLLVKDAATISIDEPRMEAGLIKFKVTVLNTRAGHKFPTDSPLRHLILLVQVAAQNTPLLQMSGPTIPVWGAPDYAGYPGEIYANILKDRDTNKMPSVAYWNPTEQGSDTRLVPGQPVQSEYSFVAPSSGLAVVTVKLIYRKAFIDIARQKGWPLIDLDIEAANARVEIVP